jgi:hypothetical protein
MTCRKSRGARHVGAEIIATLMHAPRTWEQVKVQVGMGGQTSAGWLRELRASGVIRICGYTTGAHRRARVFALQTTPFAQPDQPPPARGRA